MDQLELNQLALKLYRGALRGAAASELLARKPIADFAARPLHEYKAIRLLAIGKAGLPLAGAAEQQLEGVPLVDGLAVVPHGYPAQPLPDYEIAPSQKIRIAEAAHPVPDAAGASAAQQALELARATESDDLLLVLISGGGSALLPAFARGVSLASAQKTFKLLLHSGAAIHELNVVRKHLSLISGGRLAAAARGDVLALAVSDVPGDDLSIISSGPTVPDPSRFSEAYEILRRYGIWDMAPASVRAHIMRGMSDVVLESPKPGDRRLARAHTELLGGNADALRGAHHAAAAAGHKKVLLLEKLIQGDAREQGTRLARHASAPLDPDFNLEFDKCMLLFFGGETTLKIRGNGFGGRNQEVALQAALDMEALPYPAAILAAGSDGVDGITPPGAPAAAGALVTPQTAQRARALGLEGETFQAENNSYEFFKQLEQAVDESVAAWGGHLCPGPTHCNVMDVMFVLAPARQGV